MRAAKLTLFTVALTAVASAWPSAFFDFAQNAPSDSRGAQEKKVGTADALSRRNVGTREDQDTPFTPHKIFGNLYYVGTRSLASFLVTTPQGHILINSDYERNVPAVRQSVEALGFKY